MANLLLGVTGSVAALKTPELFAALREKGHAIKVVATQAALHFFDPRALDPTRSERNRDLVILDEDEWPAREHRSLTQRGDPVLHIELRKWADLLVIAPLDANTLAKVANGLADNCLTCIVRAWDTARPIVLAPAMNTIMWDKPATRRHLLQLAADAGACGVAPKMELDAIIELLNHACTRLHVVTPQSKRLFCGDVGVGAMAEITDIVAAVAHQIAK